MKLKYSYIILILFATGLSSCSKHLEKSPRFAWTETNAITDYPKSLSALGGIYQSFQNDNWAGIYYCALSTKAGFVNYMGINEYNFTYSQTVGGKDALWSAWYKTANLANFAIKGISTVSADKFPTPTAQQSLIAEGRILRAWVNLNLLWNFGHWWKDDEYGILYRDAPMDLTNIYPKRLSVKESYQKITEDLDYGIAHMTNYTTSKYVNKQFAQALKAKMLFIKGGYNENTQELTEALGIINDLLASLPAGLKMEPDMNQMFFKAWDNSENLFCRYLEDDGTRITTAGGWYTANMIYSGTVLPVTPGTAPSAGVLYGLDWLSADPRWPISTGPVRYPAATPNVFHYSFKKLTRQGSYAGSQANPKDEKYTTYFMRLPEVYLMKAEILARTGATISNSLAPINEYRAKRTNPVLAPLTATSREDLMDIIFKEIVCELIMENGSEFYASLRFKDAFGRRMIEGIKNGLALDENKMCYPIPNPEMLSNPYIKQNPDLEN